LIISFSILFLTYLLNTGNFDRSRIPLVSPEVDLASVNDYDEALEARRFEGGKTWVLESISGW